MEGRAASLLLLGDERGPHGHDRAEPAPRRTPADGGLGQAWLLVRQEQRVPGPGTHADTPLAPRAGRHGLCDRRDRIRALRLWSRVRILPRGPAAAHNHQGRASGPGTGPRRDRRAIVPGVRAEVTVRARSMFSRGAIMMIGAFTSLHTRTACVA